jgi:hypothetical protein
MILAVIAAVALTLGFASAASAAPLPDNCTKDKGTVSCFEGPGKNQGGVGSTNETQGNTKNTSPEPQDLECTTNPAKSQGAPNTCS